MGADRIKRFVRGLKTVGVDVAVLMHPVDVYYLTGTAQPSTLIVPVNGEATLLVARNTEGARRESRVVDIRDSSSSKDIHRVLIEKGCSDGTIGVCGDVLSANYYSRMQEALPHARLVDVSMVLRRTRAIKDEDEIRLVREAARIADIGHQAARAHLRPGVSELEVSAEIELEMVRAGGDNIVLPRNLTLVTRVVGVVSASSAYPTGGLGVTVCGPGSTPALPFGTSKRILRKDDVVIVDLAGAFDGYLADQSRPYVLGKATREQERMVAALVEIVQRGLSLLRPGARACEVYEAVKQFSVEAGYADYFMGPKERNIRFVGHGVGLELDELPVLFPGDDSVLTEGMVVAFEPILMIPGVAVATMENTILITADGNEVLTNTPMGMTEVG